MHAVHQTGFITTANIEIDGNYPKVPVFFSCVSCIQCIRIMVSIH